MFAMMSHTFTLENETATIKDKEHVVRKSNLKLFSQAIFVKRVLVNIIHVEGRSVLIILLGHSHISVKLFLESVVRHRSSHPG
jgi:hypothetical protein